MVISDNVLDQRGYRSIDVCLNRHRANGVCLRVTLPTRCIHMDVLDVVRLHLCVLSGKIIRDMSEYQK